MLNNIVLVLFIVALPQSYQKAFNNDTQKLVNTFCMLIYSTNYFYSLNHTTNSTDHVQETVSSAKNSIMHFTRIIINYFAQNMTIIQNKILQFLLTVSTVQYIQFLRISVYSNMAAFRSTQFLHSF